MEIVWNQYFYGSGTDFFFSEENPPNVFSLLSGVPHEVPEIPPDYAESSGAVLILLGLNFLGKSVY